MADSMTAICDLAALEERDLTDTEDENLKALREDADRLDIRCQELRDIQLSNAAAAQLRAEVTSTPEAAEKATQVRVGDEPLTYGERSGTSFFRDLYASQIHHDPYQPRGASPATRPRWRSSTAIRAPPASLASSYRSTSTQLAAELARAGRPFANLCTQLPLPNGWHDHQHRAA